MRVLPRKQRSALFGYLFIWAYSGRCYCSEKIKWKSISTNKQVQLLVAMSLKHACCLGLLPCALPNMTRFQHLHMEGGMVITDLLTFVLHISNARKLGKIVFCRIDFMLLYAKSVLFIHL